MQQNAGGQSDKINAKVKISIANTFLTHFFCGMHGNRTKNRNNLRMRVCVKN